ncbi:Kinase [Hexamita inflata]|uniref:Kinase n=1 Tax=Hexamita inflata TaxID=28002 RepID=A0ABP1HPE3_9EUKA
MKTLQLLNRKLQINGFSNIQFLEQGSFVTCFTAINNNQEKVVITVSNNANELETRMSASDRVNGIQGVQKYYEYNQLKINQNELNEINKIYPGVFSQTSAVLIGPFYETHFNTHIAKLKLKEKIELFHELLKIVKQIHTKGIYHMDLKPSNIMIQNGKPIIIDFGQAVSERIVESVQNTSAYAPKHDVYSCRVFSEKFDVYCLGNILHEIYINQPLSSPLSTIEKLQNAVGESAASCIFGMTLRQQDYRYTLDQCLTHPLFNPQITLEEFYTANRIVVSCLPSAAISRNYSYSNAYQQNQPTQSNFQKQSLQDLCGFEMFSCIQSCALSLENSDIDLVEYI